MQTSGSNGPRVKISPQRLTGKITDWKGSFGWIQPDKPVTHAQAMKHKGLIYLSQADVDAEISGIGAAVSFFCYADNTGLGAASCRPVTGVPPVMRTIVKPPSTTAMAAFAAASGHKAVPSAKGSGKGGGGQRQRVRNTPMMGEVKSFRAGPGGYGWIIPMEPIHHPLAKEGGNIYVKSSDVVGNAALQSGMTVSFILYADPQGLGAEQCRIVDGSGMEEYASASTPRVVTPKVVNPALAGKVAVKPGLVSKPTAAGLVSKPATGGFVSKTASSGPPADLGPRERLTVVATTGEVIDWRGAYGWVKPHEEVDHPAASKRQGNVYVGKKDIVGGQPLEVGQLVQFHVFVDKSGLGAEECTPF